MPQRGLKAFWKGDLCDALISYHTESIVKDDRLDVPQQKAVFGQMKIAEIGFVWPEDTQIIFSARARTESQHLASSH